MEQVNQEIKAYLRVFVSHHQDDWVDWLPLAKFAYNNCIHSATCCTPFKLDSGQHPQMGSEPTWSSAVETADNFAQQMSQMQDEAKAALKHAADEIVRAHLRPGTYHVLVLMELQQICRTGAQGDGSLLNALSRKCYMRMLQYVHRGTLP